jgi:ribonuclease HI
VNVPEYLLLVDTVGAEPGEWRLVLHVVGGDVELDITDVEPEARGERLELLTVVRGLEALDQPSQVNVVTASRYVRNGIELGLPQWRAKGWKWESFGRLERVKHADLWQRLDRAATIHEVRCAGPVRHILHDGAQSDEFLAGRNGGAFSLASVEAAGGFTAPRRRIDGGHGLIRRRRRRAARSGLWGLVRALVGG